MSTVIRLVGFVFSREPKSFIRDPRLLRGDDRGAAARRTEFHSVKGGSTGCERRN